MGKYVLTKKFVFLSKNKNNLIVAPIFNILLESVICFLWFYNPSNTRASLYNVIVYSESNLIERIYPCYLNTLKLKSIALTSNPYLINISSNYCISLTINPSFFQPLAFASPILSHYHSPHSLLISHSSIPLSH